MSTVDALQAALRSEHALVHAYSVLGARTSAAQSPTLHDQLVETYREHRARRDSLHTFVIEAGAVPVAALATYDVPEHWTNAAALATAALDLEARSTESMAALVAGTSGRLRGWALGSMAWSANRIVVMGGEPTTWPGAPELS